MENKYKYHPVTLASDFYVKQLISRLIMGAYIIIYFAL